MRLVHRITILYSPPSDPEAFTEHYRSTHLALARAVPGLRRVTLSTPRGGPDAPYLVAELWFDDADSMRTALKSPEMETTTADATALCARTGSSMIAFTGAVEEISTELA